MKTFRCECGNTLYFPNTQCLRCQRMVGYLPDLQRISALEPADNQQWLALANRERYRQCRNFTNYQVCNWMVPASDESPFCASCRLNHIIPNLTDDQNLTRWGRIEQAKRRLLYTLYALRLPVIGRTAETPNGMGFEFLQDEVQHDVFSNELTILNNVTTGHRAGMITINVLEAEHAEREAMREKMNERYRTLLGHFRHESGHFYWELLIRNSRHLEEFRQHFGDERLDYQQALNTYYDQGPLPDWQQYYISAYASMHPWEDWAESWAHYLHMVDTLETADDLGVKIHPDEDDAPVDSEALSSKAGIPPDRFEYLFAEWHTLTTTLNALNRSMGLEDAYPFIIGDNAAAKLEFVHRVIRQATT
ncbi:MAG: putative zinc-binding metallopeptidase [Wenzhouxiangellaceae bacterium]